ncbi:hypothetical protein Tsubulata_009031 [Turnera subulata]|uniref:RRM domain-containing protein n=1 Tax=Turnera subulata TaxID=218843 RepID=A0A9Q0FMY0_9ROSI|nr:hypothetical protein Tsubulata_009031 [Turnera subulata]
MVARNFLSTLPMSPGLPQANPHPRSTFFFPLTTSNNPQSSNSNQQWQIPRPKPPQPPRAFPTNTHNNQDLHQKKPCNPNYHKPVYLAKWNKNSILSAIDNNQLLSVYVENIPIQWTAADILSVLSNIEDIIDVYIPTKRAKSGKRFGFIRFKKGNPQEEILEKISATPVVGGFLMAN